MQEAAKRKTSPLNKDQTEKGGTVANFDDYFKKIKDKCVWIEDEFLAQMMGPFKLEFTKRIEELENGGKQQ